MVTTSLKIPAMERVTTEVRCSKANSEAVMQNAMHPGNKSKSGPKIGPFSSTRMCRPAHSAEKPSTGIAIIRREANIVGAR